MKYRVKLKGESKLPAIVRDGVEITHEGVEMEASQVTASMKRHPHIEIVEVVEEVKKTKTGTETRKEEKETEGEKATVSTRSARKVTDKEAAGDGE